MADQELNTSDAGDQPLDLGQAVEGAAKEAGDKEAKGKEEASSETEKTYTQANWAAREAEWNKRYGGLDTKLTETSKSTKTEIERLSQALADAEERANDAAGAGLLRKAEEDGGDVDYVKTVLAREKAVRQSERATEARKKELDARDSILAEAGKGKAAIDLITEFELDKSATEELLALDTPEKMRIKALELRLEKVKAGATPVTETDSSKTNKKASTDNMSIEERLARAMEGKL